MKSQKTVEVTACDFCGKPSHEKCEECGIDLCHDCREKGLAQEFQTRLGFTCGDDPNYCAKCLEKIRANPTRLFKALLELKRIYDEYVEYEKEFRRQQKLAEAEIVQARIKR